MENVEQDKNAAETKQTAPTRAEPSNQYALNRIANKQRKKRAHRRTLRRSNTKG